MGCKSLDDIAHSGHRNIKISGDGLVALRLSMFFSLKSTDNSLFPLLSFLHAQCDAQHKGVFSILTGCKCDYYIAHICYSPQVQITGASHAWKAVISYNFDKAPIILSSPFLSYWLLVLCQLDHLRRRAQYFVMISLKKALRVQLCGNIINLQNFNVMRPEHTWAFPTNQSHMTPRRTSSCCNFGDV